MRIAIIGGATAAARCAEIAAKMDKVHLVLALFDPFRDKNKL